MRAPVSHYRTRIAWVLGVSGCCAVAAAACEPRRTTAGLLVAPTTSATSGDAAAAPAGDGGSDAALAYRPLPEEPHGSRGQRCDRDVTCTPGLDEAPTWPFPPPFANCGSMPSGGREGDGTFSQAETNDRRKLEADVCCYVKLDCSGSRGTPRKRAPAARMP